MLFVFEGPDGVGKSTQIELTAQWLRALGINVLTTREPGGHPKFGGLIREILLNDGNKVDGVAMLYGMMFDRGLHSQKVVVPALEAGLVVLCDRMFESSLVYQGQLGGHGVHMVQQLNYLFLKDTYKKWVPKMATFVFDGEDAALEARVNARIDAGASDDKFDKAGYDFRQQVREAYRLVTKETQAQYARVQIDAAAETDVVQARIREPMSVFLRVLGKHKQIEPRDYALSPAGKSDAA